MIRCLLLATSGPHAGCGVSVKATESIVVGRNAPRGLSIRDDLYLSREHFTIASEGSSFRLIDAQSRNGTYLNGHRINSAVLADGDVVRAGGTEFRVEIHLGESPSSRSLPPFAIFPEKNSPAGMPGKSELDSVNDTRRYLDPLPEHIAVRAISGIESAVPPQPRAVQSSETVYVGTLGNNSSAGIEQTETKSSSPAAPGSDLPPGVSETWLNTFAFQVRPSHRNSYYAFQSSDFFALSQFLLELHRRYDFYLIVNRSELQPAERTQLNKFVMEGQAGSLSNALLWVHGWKVDELDTLYKMLYAKDCGIAFGVPVESKLRTKDLQQMLGPLSYPSVLVKTFSNENLVVIDSLFQNIDLYIVEGKLEKPCWLLYTSPRFFGIFRR
jgi:hypothetical protein